MIICYFHFITSENKRVKVYMVEILILKIKYYNPCHNIRSMLSLSLIISRKRNSFLLEFTGYSWRWVELYVKCIRIDIYGAIDSLCDGCQTNGVCIRGSIVMEQSLLIHVISKLQLKSSCRLVVPKEYWPVLTRFQDLVCLDKVIKFIGNRYKHQRRLQSLCLHPLNRLLTLCFTKFS